ncbi:DUF7108 domain-containing protein [Halalkalirubrum salinum]|uniref:DUF7108 domain-containing protein n=1 Tax=Halalkalirubrum salinum TaxID=2563889 RepID=UPI001F0D8D85|nr:rnhA operon protein [Halalkalirubrum salinum]
MTDHTPEMTDDTADSPLPEDVVSEAERLTALAADAVDNAAKAAYRRERDRLVADHDYSARLREEDSTLVLYPAGWTEDGTVQFDRIDDTDRAIEVPLGPQEGDNWAAVEAHNQSIVEAVAEDASALHAKNVRAFADFMGNHYLQPLDTATAEQLTVFYEEYYPRNAWASERQQAVVEASIRIAFRLTDASYPL